MRFRWFWPVLLIQAAFSLFSFPNPWFPEPHAICALLVLFVPPKDGLGGAVRAPVLVPSANVVPPGLDASGDSLYATRFDGARAYIVTYFTVDPLFVIDLSDPSAPKRQAQLRRTAIIVGLMMMAACPLAAAWVIAAM